MPSLVAVACFVCVFVWCGSVAAERGKGAGSVRGRECKLLIFDIAESDYVQQKMAGRQEEMAGSHKPLGLGYSEKGVG